MTVGELMERVLTEFPEWSNSQALAVAEQITAYSEQMAFQLDVERDLAALPLMEVSA